MKKLLLASVGVVAMATAATAADLPARMPAKAPAYVVPLYNWTGFYIGGHLGWARVDLDSTLVGPIGPFPAGTGFGGRDDGFIYGGQIGFNYQVSQWVFGIEGQLSGTSDIGRNGTNTGLFLGTPFSANSTASVDWIATLAGRIGVAVGPAGNILIYGKGGVAWMDWSVCGSTTFLGVTTGGGCGGSTETGWMVGVGAEYGFTPNWSAKIEYNYLDLGTQRTTFAAGGPVIDTDLTTHIVKVGINYRFGGLFR